EVKSLRASGCSIEESFALIEGQEVFVYSLNIPEYLKSSYFKAKPTRTRKLLLHKKEIKRLVGLTAQKGFTLIPLKIYFNDRGLVKLELALAKGRLIYDKRKKIKEKISKRETERVLKAFNKGH
ncbi:MAG: SsrA-binding protein SmpB, partial [Candidatus Omnitrophota bacterium]